MQAMQDRSRSYLGPENNGSCHSLEGVMLRLHLLDWPASSLPSTLLRPPRAMPRVLRPHFLTCLTVNCLVLIVPWGTFDCKRRVGSVATFVACICICICEDNSLRRKRTDVHCQFRLLLLLLLLFGVSCNGKFNVTQFKIVVMGL